MVFGFDNSIVEQKSPLIVALSLGNLLNILDGTGSSNNGLIHILTTNYREKLDKSLTRPGRIDQIYHFNYCDEEQIKEICNHYIELSEEKTKFFNTIKKIKTTSSALVHFLFKKIKMYHSRIKKADISISENESEVILYPNN